MIKFVCWLFDHVARFITRLFAGDPLNPYERIAFNAMYEAGVQLRKGTAR